MGRPHLCRNPGSGVLDFTIQDAQVQLGTDDGLDTQVILGIDWTSTHFYQRPEWTQVTVSGNRIDIDLFASQSGGVGLPVVWRQAVPVAVPSLAPGAYSVTATLYESLTDWDFPVPPIVQPTVIDPLLPYFYPTWESSGDVDLQYPGAHSVTVEAGQEIAGIDFGNRPLPGEIHGSKWYDLDGDGQRDEGEQGLADWTIYLDMDGSGDFSAGDMSTTTDASA